MCCGRPEQENDMINTGVLQDKTPQFKMQNYGKLNTHEHAHARTHPNTHHLDIYMYHVDMGPSPEN